MQVNLGGVHATLKLTTRRKEDLRFEIFDGGI